MQLADARCTFPLYKKRHGAMRPCKHAHGLVSLFAKLLSPKKLASVVTQRREKLDQFRWNFYLAAFIAFIASL